nr:amidohydrolase family protein [Nocardia brasiliensis]
MHSHTVGRPSVLRGGTVLTMDPARTVLDGHDVLVVDGRIAAVGVGLVVPDGTDEIDARGGIVMPGMVNTHRHMWQTTTRGYGADWTLTQYFVWYYLNWGTKFRPEDIYAGNLLGALEALDAGVTTCVDWSHGLQTIDHADAAVDALAAVPGRFVLAYGNIQDAPANWTGTPEFREFFDRRSGDLEGFQIAFDVTGDPSFPEQQAFEVARELDLAVTTHAGVWGATGDDAVRLIHEHGYAEARTVYVHASTLSADSYARIAASGGSVSVSTESEQSAGQGYPATAALRAHGIPVSLSLDSCVLCSGDLFSAMRTTLGADRAAEHQAAHARGETVTHASLARRAGRRVGDAGWRASDRARQRDRQRAGRQEGRPRARPQRRFAGDGAAAQPARTRRPACAAGRCRHSPGRRRDRETRPPAGRRRPGRCASGGAGDGRLPARRTRGAGLARGHEPADPRDQGPRQPLHLHRLPVSSHAR